MASQRNDSAANSWEAGREDRAADFSRAGGGFYEIRVRGHLNGRWADWFDGLEARPLANGDTTLRGLVVDQAALIGLLNKVNHLNLTLLSVSKYGQRKPADENH